MNYHVHLKDNEFSLYVETDGSYYKVDELVANIPLHIRRLLVGLKLDLDALKIVIGPAAKAVGK
jgi:hypothetical protein